MAKMPLPPRSRTFIRLTTAVACVMVGATCGLLYRARAQQDITEVTTPAPGISLTSCLRQLPQGPLRFWVVSADKSQGWRLGLENADPANAIKKQSVRNLAARSGATVAVNGGFFAYGGAAVGAVRSGGEWFRMPWKSRTALGWSDAGQAALESLQGTVQVKLGGKVLEGVTLNGLSSAYSYATDNAFSVITPRFGKQVWVRANQTVLTIIGNKVTLVSPSPVPVPEQNPVTDLAPLPQNQLTPPEAPGATLPPANPVPPSKISINVPANGWLLVCLNDARSSEALVPTGTSATYQVNLQPTSFASWPNILGAGPRLVDNSQIRTTEKEEEFRPDVLARGPRTAVGWNANGNWMMLVADGRQAESVGLTLPETAQLFREFGATEAMNLDGGSSTQLVINGQLVNNPSGIDPVNLLRRKEVQVTNALTLSRSAPN